MALTGWAFGNSTADNNANPSPTSNGDCVLMVGLESRIGDLQDIEYAHLDMVNNIRENGGATEEANLSVPFEGF